MRIYLAAPWLRRPEAIAAGQRFSDAGHVVTSRWFHHTSDGDPNDATGITCSPDSILQQANEDIEDVMRADALVVLNLEKSEGKAVETGIAIAMGMPVISVGPRSNIFQALGYEVADIDAALEVLATLSDRG